VQFLTQRFAAWLQVSCAMATPLVPAQETSRQARRSADRNIDASSNMNDRGGGHILLGRGNELRTRPYARRMQCNTRWNAWEPNPFRSPKEIVMQNPIVFERRNRVAIVTVNRPERRNAFDLATAEAIYRAFKQFDADETLDVAVLTGAGGNFCAGADLHALAQGEPRPFLEDGDFAPMGCTRLKLSKPVIAAIEGYAVAGGIEVACWCDLRVAAKSATFGVFCRRFGVPLVDLGTIRLPRLIGHSRAMDLILTGRPVKADEALMMGLANRVVEDGEALPAALEIAEQLSAFPQVCMRADRMSAINQWSLDWDEATRNEMKGGLPAVSQEAIAGATRFSGGTGRHGKF
jgi:enoyl-CoA hydratase